MYENEIKELKEKHEEERIILINEREIEINEKKEFEIKFDEWNDNYNTLKYDYDWTIESYQKERKEFEDKINELSTQLQIINQNQQKEIWKVEEELKEILRVELDKKNQEIILIKSDSEANFLNFQSIVTKEKESLNNRIQNLIEENMQLLSKIQEFNTDIPNSHYLSQIEELKIQNDDMNEKTKSIKVRAKNDINDLKQKIVNLQNEKDESLAKTQNLERQLQKTKEKLKSTQEEVMNNRNLTTNHLEKYEELVNTIHSKDSEIKQIKISFKRLSDEYSFAIQELNDVKLNCNKRIEEYESAIKVKQKKVDKLEDSLSKCKNLIEKNKSSAFTSKVEQNVKTIENDRKYWELKQKCRYLIDVCLSNGIDMNTVKKVINRRNYSSVSSDRIRKSDSQNSRIYTPSNLNDATWLDDSWISRSIITVKVFVVTPHEMC